MYRAERRILTGGEFDAEDEIRSYIAEVTTSAWWCTRGWPDRVQVRVGGTGAEGGVSIERYPSVRQYGWIRLPTPGLGPQSWECRELIVAHELAHVSLIAERDDRTHGPVFCGRYLEFVAELIDGLTAAELALALRLDGVQITQPALV